MDKNAVAIVVVVGVVALAGIGYAFWSKSQPAPVADQTQTDTTGQNTDNTTVAVNTDNTVQANLPAVQTDSTTAPYISTVVVKGTVTPNGALTTYWYEYGLTSNLGTKTKGYLAGSGFSKVYAPAYITGLTSNTNYYFRLSANNSMGTVNGTTYTFKTNTTPAPTGTAPTITTASATNVDTNVASLKGQINPNGSQTTFWFEYGLSSNLGGVTAFQSAGTDSASQPVSVSITGLQPMTKYYFRLNGQNQFGTINGQILNFTTKGPAAGTVPTLNTDAANAVTATLAKVNASINPNGSQTTYWFEYKDNSLLSNVIVSNTPEQTLDSGTSSTNVSTTINNLKSNTKYSVTVVARNQYGTARGDTETFTTKR